MMKSVTSWLERKLFLKVNASKTKIPRPNGGKCLGFGYWKSAKGWECRPLKDRQKRLYTKCKAVETIRKLNEILRGWINYYRIGSMKQFIDKFGQWLRHKVRVVIVKRWMKPERIYLNLQKLNRMFKCKMTEEDIFKVANSRLGWYRRCGMNVVNYLLSPKVLEMPNRKRRRPGLIQCH